MTCSHTKPNSRGVKVFVGYDDDGNSLCSDILEEVSAYEDIDLHRAKCSLCGDVRYYSERARRHFEDGIHDQRIHESNLRFMSSRGGRF